MSFQTSRRDFLKTSTIAGAGFLVAAGSTAKVSRASALEGLAIAGIGVGGKGSSDIDQAALYGKVVALCDTDKNTLQGKAQNFKDSNPKLYTDYRELFAEMMDKIDAVTVSTPDHMHAIITATAIKAGKHAYTQKPLTRTIGEARYLGYLAKKYGVKDYSNILPGHRLRDSGGSPSDQGRRHWRNQGRSYLDEPPDLGSGSEPRSDARQVCRTGQEGRAGRR